MSELLNNNDYKTWLSTLKGQIKHSQIKAALAVNSELIQLYWDLGKQIVEKQENTKWGSGFIEQLSRDLKSEFPEISAFSAKNLRYCKSFFEYLGNPDFSHLLNISSTDNSLFDKQNRPNSTKFSMEKFPQLSCNASKSPCFE